MISARTYIRTIATGGAQRPRTCFWSRRTISRRWARRCCVEERSTTQMTEKPGGDCQPGAGAAPMAGVSPIGHRVYSGDLHAWATVVGEVGDVHSYSLDRAPVPNLYLPEASRPGHSDDYFYADGWRPRANWMTVRRVLRGRTGLTVRYVESMPELMTHAVALRQFLMWVVTAFGLLALGLATFRNL